MPAAKTRPSQRGRSEEAGNGSGETCRREHPRRHQGASGESKPEERRSPAGRVSLCILFFLIRGLFDHGLLRALRHEVVPGISAVGGDGDAPRVGGHADDVCGAGGVLYGRLVSENMIAGEVSVRNPVRSNIRRQAQINPGSIGRSKHGVEEPVSPCREQGGPVCGGVCE